MAVDPRVILLLNYYRGLNPHGQFRSEELRYWGLEFRVRL